MIRRLSALVMICALALSGLAGIVPAAAQTGITVNIRTVDAQTGESIRSACFVLVDFSNTGCDENGDGRSDTKASRRAITWSIKSNRRPAM